MPTPNILHNDYTARARLTDPATSHMAAETVKISRSWPDVWEALTRLAPCIAEPVQDALAGKHTPQRVRTAIKELLRIGAIAYTGEQQLTRHGRKANVVKTLPDSKTGMALTRIVEARKWTL